MKLRGKVVVLVIALVSVGLLTAWKINRDRPRPIATVKLANHLKPFVDYVTFYMDDAKGEKVNQYLHLLKPGHGISVAVITPELTFHQITCEHPNFEFILSYEKHVKIPAGRIYVVTVAQDGTMTGKFEP